MLAKNQHFGQKSKFWSKIEILVNIKKCSKFQILVKQKFVQKPNLRQNQIV